MMLPPRVRKLFRGLRPPRRHLPPHIYPDDVFLVSYPKSGNTWMRFLLANVLSDGEEVDFHNLPGFVTSVRLLFEQPTELRRPRIIKSHAPRYIPEYPRVIHLVRDGRDVYVSLYFHMKDQLPPGASFLQFLQQERYLRGGWGRHVDSWLSPEPSPRLLLLRYEDLLRDPEKHLQRAVEFIGISCSAEQLRRAVGLSSFDRMKRMERERGRPRGRGKTVPFVRRGVAGDWKAFFGEQEARLFKSRGEGKALVRLGYELDESW